MKAPPQHFVKLGGGSAVCKISSLSENSRVFFWEVFMSLNGSDWFLCRGSLGNACFIFSIISADSHVGAER